MEKNEEIMTEHDCDKLGKNRIFLTTKENWVHRIPYGIWVLETVQCNYIKDISFCPFCGTKLKEEENEKTCLFLQKLNAKIPTDVFCKDCLDLLLNRTYEIACPADHSSEVRICRICGGRLLRLKEES